MTTADHDLVVLSHLRWTWVWQRPQHIISRLARERAARGGRTWFVEEPAPTHNVTRPTLRTEDTGDVTRVWLEIPAGGDVGHRQFDAPGAESYAAQLLELVGEGNHVWLYTPMALDIAEALRPAMLIYDVMDDLASFKNAPAGLLLRQRRTLALADVVFTGGRSLDRSVAAARSPLATHCFPSGVESSHYAQSRALRVSRQRPVAGYVGVIDERLDLRLIARLARDLPDWAIHMAGPLAKIAESELPQAKNIKWLGMQRYEDLPRVMAGFDVALMPFALNESTKNISPTKTLEYLAAGLPVVSTRVADVESDFGDAVHLIDTPQEFAPAVVHVSKHSVEKRDEITAAVRRNHEWDVIAMRMAAIIASHSGYGIDITDPATAGKVSA
jgi:glycosyltransferase involved in cell wall biosynthesis